MSALDIVALILAAFVAVDVVVVAVLTRRVDTSEQRAEERCRLRAELEDAEEKSYRVIGGSRRGPEQAGRRAA